MRLLLIDLSFFHDEGDAAQSLDVFERVAFDGDDVGKHSGFEITDFVSHTESLCWSACSLDYSLTRLQPQRYAPFEFRCRVTRHPRGGIRAENDRCAFLYGFGKRFRSRLHEVACITQLFFVEMEFLSIRQIIFGQIKVRYVDDVFLDEQIDNGVIHQRAVLDSVRTGQNCPTYGLRCVGVDRNRFACLVGFIDSGFELLEGIRGTAAGPTADSANGSPDTNSRGPAISPELMALRRSTSTRFGAPRLRSVVNPLS